MPRHLAELLIVATLSWLTAQAPGQQGQGPSRGPGPGREPASQDPGRPPRPGDDGPGDFPPPPPFGPPPNPLFLAIDLDGDGELSAKEVAAASKSIAKLDRNKDGIISEDEVRPPPPPGRRRGRGGPAEGPDGPPPPGEGPPGGGPGGRGSDAQAMVDSVMRFDKNGDGKVTAKELPERMARMLEQGDTNQDGALERSEIETLSRRPSPRRPGPHGGGPPRGAPPGEGPP
jgi:hypothetical protein